MNDSFDGLIARLRAGDEEAAEVVFHRFANRLMALARKRLGQMVRHKVDPEDVLQSAYKSFFLRQKKGQFQPQSWENLWGLLATITLRKCGHRIEKLYAARRDVRREVDHRAKSDDSSASWEAIAREPTPDEAAILAETVQQVLAGFNDAQRQIVQLSLQGFEIVEVSKLAGCTERTVYRVLERVRTKLERLRVDPNERA